MPTRRCQQPLHPPLVRHDHAHELAVHREPDRPTAIADRRDGPLEVGPRVVGLDDGGEGLPRVHGGIVAPWTPHVKAKKSPNPQVSTLAC